MLNSSNKGLIVVVFLLSFLAAFSQEEKKWSFKENVVLDGYVKYLSTASFSNSSNLMTNNIIHNRINAKVYLSDKLTTKVALRNRLIYGEVVKLTPNYGTLISQDDGVRDFSILWVDDSAVVLHTIIDRAYLDYAFKKWQIRVGRQRINWGINLAWNTNDLFNTYNIVNFDYEEKAGTDAVRIQYYFKKSNIDVAYRPGKDLDHSVIAGLYKFNKWKYDIQLLGANYYEDIALGAGWAGNIKKAGFKGEASFFQNKTTANNLTTVSTSVDYFFKKGMYLNVSALYTSDGQNSFNPSALAFASSSLSAKTLMPTKYSSLVQVSQEVNPRLKASFTAIYGFGMNILFAMPSVAFSIQENWDIDLTGQLFYAEVQNDFKNLNNSLFLRLRYSY